MAAAPLIRPVLAERAGSVVEIDTRALGMAVVSLGGGRTRADQEIDPSVGLSDVAALGEKVTADAVLAMIHARDEASADAAAEMVKTAYLISDQPVAVSPVISEIILATEIAR